MTQGGKRLVMLGIISISIAILTTAVSLAIYHDSGDIYIDRSRPGFLPEKTDLIEVEPEEDPYKFSDEKGSITTEEIEEYLIELEETQKKLDAVPNPFSPTSISDEALNISE